MYVGEGFYPSRAVGTCGFMKPIGEHDGALREGQSPSPTASRVVRRAGRCGHRPLQTVYVVALDCANLSLHLAGGQSRPPLQGGLRGRRSLCQFAIASCAGGVEPRPYGVTDGAAGRENIVGMLTNADFLGTLSSKLCDDKDEYGLFPCTESRRGV